MAIDLRADVNCSLGTLISGSISDSYIQGAGLVTSQGNAEISGLITPEPGTIVTFTYTKDSVTRTIPKKLRVLSSFADPFKRTTSVELGCKLTYLNDLREEIDWTAYDDIENNELPENEIALAPIYASSVMNECLSQLGITASSIPLTNRFTIPRFDFSPGYIQILGDLLVSESYFGYLDENEVLQIVYLTLGPGSGRVYTSNDIIELGPINSGDLPGQAVVVTYSTLKLKAPAGEDTELINWEKEETVGEPYEIRIPYNDNENTAIYTGIDSSITETTYKILKKPFWFSVSPSLFGGSYRGPVTKVVEIEVKDTQTTTISGPSVKEMQQTAAAYLENGIGYSSYNQILEQTVQTYSYDYNTGEETGSETIYYKSVGSAFSQLDLPWVFGEDDYVSFGDGLIIVGRSSEETATIGDYRKTVSKTYRWWPETTSGQQAIAELKEVFNDAGEVSEYCNSIIEVLVLEDIVVTTNNSGRTVNGRPPAIERNNAFSSKAGSIAENSWRTESKAELELVFGSATAQRRVEFAMPYASDDFYYGNQFGQGDAERKANRYGRVQNQLLLGNRSGASIQIAPDNMPDAPFTPMYVQANGLTAMYRSNGSQWAFSAEGIVCSVDALFWGAVGGTGTFWFPVAPGIVSLPETPPVTGGTMNPDVVVPAYNETAIYESNLIIGLDVIKYNYELELLTVIPVLSVRILANVSYVLQVFPPVADVNLAVLVPEVGTGAAVIPPSSSVSVAAIDPGIVTGEPIAGPVDISAPAANIDIVGLIPTAGPTDPLFSSVSLLLHMDGSNGSTTFTDSSLNNLTVTRTGETVISNVQSKFGGTSAYFEDSDDFAIPIIGTNDGLNFPEITYTGDFTIECWIYPISLQDANVLCGSPSNGFQLIRINSPAQNDITTYADPLGIGSPSNMYIQGTGAITINAWQHVALCRSGTNIRLFVNGVQKGATETSFTQNGGAIKFGVIGKLYEDFRHYRGYMDELRATAAARYTANFTPPTAPFPNQ